MSAVLAKFLLQSNLKPMLHDLESLCDILRNIHECLRLWSARTRDNRWFARIGIRADLWVQWYVSQQIDAHLTTFPSRSVQAEYVMFVSAVGTDECAHVLYNT